MDGVGYADILGNREYAMRVWLKPDRMLAYKISADEVMKSLSEQSLEASPGKTGESSGKRSQSFEYVLKYSGRFNSKEQYENVILRSSPNGEILRLKDVADVEFGSSMYDIYSNLNGRPSAALVLKQSYGSNASQVIAAVKEKMKEIKASSFPKGMDYEISYDVSRFLDASIDKVIHTLVEAFVLVGLVVFLFFGRLALYHHSGNGCTGFARGHICIHAILRHHPEPDHPVCLGAGHWSGSGRCHRGDRSGACKNGRGTFIALQSNEESDA